MANRDFIDDDLIKPRDELNRIKMGPADEPARPGRAEAPAEGVGRSVSDLDLPLMARHKHVIDTEAAMTTEKLERLRQQQEDLERQKRELEEARRKQMDFLKGKQELIEHLTQSLVTLERNEIKASQMAELLQGTRTRFRTMLDEIKAIHEDEWSDADVREEISKALVRIDDARIEYNKSMARLDAVMGAEEKSGVGEHRPVIFEDSTLHHEVEHGFGHWFFIGVAVTLPLILALAVLFVVVYFMRAAGLF